MNVKALATLVGALSLGTLATGCASTKAAGNPGAESTAKGAESSCKGAESSCKGTKAAETPEKGAEGKCGEGSCGKK
ncbi:hypothetical protein POL68_32240 [Stigmatella sp. ncwal1]|uniref:Lipoprotein n=1 Tax=Stigmatella ashevillensis TaxID=2995309 RepID=A0ABT5DLE3_9BACT|nr:hypothetical protein [Stigmatella ashevillena]MDC0713176.1 hypothetical protein [Stigmatella ashevillena]